MTTSPLSLIHIYLLEVAEHGFDACQPSPRLFVVAVGVGQRQVDTRRHRLALPHFVEQVVHDLPLPRTGCAMLRAERWIGEGPGTFLAELPGPSERARHEVAFALLLRPQIAALSSACARDGAWGRRSLSLIHI